MPSDRNGPVVSLRELEKSFGGFIAVNRVTLDIRQGEIFGFLGPNGAGKSTTIRMLCGILQPTGGHGTVAGLDIIREPEEIKKQIGYMSQKFSLYDDLTVEENIDFYSGIYRIPRAKRVKRKEWVLSIARLSKQCKTRTGNLSAGWKQRLALGCAILHEPPVVFLDEPTSGVDPITRRNFWDLIYQLADEGITVFVTTHYMDEAEYCDRLGLMYRGKLIAEGSPESLKTSHMKDEIVELFCERPQDVMEMIERLTGVRHVSLHGRALHVVVDKATAVIPQIEAMLSAAGISASSPERIPASLEDVFVSLIEVHDRLETPLREFAF